MSTYYKDVDTPVAKLAFPNKLCNYVYLNSDGKTYSRGSLYNTDKTSYERIKTIMQGNEAAELSEGDKVFVLPGHPLTSDRIREYLKRENATLTKDISKATIIAGCDIGEEVKAFYSNQAKLTSIMFKAQAVMLNKTVENDFDKEFDSLPDGELIKKQWYDDKTPCVLSKTAYNNKGYGSNYIVNHDKYFLTPYLMEVVYYLLAKKLKVLTADYITDRAHSKAKLDDDNVFDNIYSMLSSSDEANQRLGAELLSHSDFSGPVLYKVWILANNVTHNVEKIKTKAMKHFIAESGWNDVKGMSDLQILKYLKDKGEITKANAKTILPRIFSDTTSYVKRVTSNIYYDYEVGETEMTIRLKPEWAEMLEEDAETVSL